MPQRDAKMPVLDGTRVMVPPAAVLLTVSMPVSMMPYRVTLWAWTALAAARALKAARAVTVKRWVVLVIFVSWGSGWGKGLRLAQT